jgi:hypothetical protein
MWLERARTGKNSGEMEKAYQQLMKRVKKIDPLTIAETTDSKFLTDGVPRVAIPFLHSWFELDLVPYRLRGGHEMIDTLPMKVLVLLHLIAAAENEGTAVRVMGQWIDCRSLHDGAVLGAHFSKNTTQLMSRFFAFHVEERMRRALTWGGKPVDLADDGLVFSFFPRLPMAVVNWEADEEFPAYSKILYDVSASNYMPTHGLVALTDFLIHKLAE